jgi:DNA-binding IclR family transcriptional regulator
MADILSDQLEQYLDGLVPARPAEMQTMEAYARRAALCHHRGHAHQNAELESGVSNFCVSRITGR